MDSAVTYVVLSAQQQIFMNGTRHGSYSAVPSNSVDQRASTKGMTQFKVIYQSGYVNTYSEHAAFDWKAGLTAIGGAIALATHVHMLLLFGLRHAALFCGWTHRHAQSLKKVSRGSERRDEQSLAFLKY